MAADNAMDEARSTIGFQNVPFWGLLRVDTDRGPCDWGASEIEQAATSDGCYGRHITAGQRMLGREDVSHHKVAQLLAELGHEKDDRSRPRGWVLPPLDRARAAWDRLKFPVVWLECPGWAELDARSGRWNRDVDAPPGVF